MTRNEFARKLRKALHRKYGHVNPLPEEAGGDLEDAEARLGFPLPGIVRFIYKKAGVDFFSPEWSAKTYLEMRSEPKWPERMVPIADEGCGIWLCLDCSRKQAPVLHFRGDELPGDLVFEHAAPSFVEYLRGELPRSEGGYAKD
jgi:hypothetical protein